MLQALYIAIVGMLIVFACLGLVMLPDVNRWQNIPS